MFNFQVLTMWLFLLFSLPYFVLIVFLLFRLLFVMLFSF